MKTVNDEMGRMAEEITERIRRFLPSQKGYQKTVAEAMTYSA